MDRLARLQRGEFGNAGPNCLRRPGVYVWDISFNRNIKLTERTSARLQVETYNTFNPTQFTGVNQTARFQAPERIDPTFLETTSAANPRRIQFALRINW